MKQVTWNYLKLFDRFQLQWTLCWDIGGGKKREPRHKYLLRWIFSGQIYIRTWWHVLRLSLGHNMLLNIFHHLSYCSYLLSQLERQSGGERETQSGGERERLKMNTRHRNWKDRDMVKTKKIRVKKTETMNIQQGKRGTNRDNRH